MKNNHTNNPPIAMDRGTPKDRGHPSISTPLLLLYAVIATLLVALIKTAQGICYLFHYCYICVSQTITMCFTPHIHCKHYQ